MSEAFVAALAERTPASMEGDALATHRAEALARFRELGLPSKREEAWRHTDLRAISRRSFLPAAAVPSSEVAYADLERLGLPDALELVVLDGVLRQPSQELPPGLSLEVLSQGAAVAAPADAVGDGFGALHGAFLSEVLALRVRGRVERPVLIRHLASTGEQPRLACPAVRIHLEAGADLTLVEQQLRMPACEDLTIASLDLTLEDGAQLDWTRLRVGADAGYRLDRDAVHLANDARLHATHLDVGGRWNRSEVTVHLDGPGAEAAIDGLYAPQDRQTHEHRIAMEHVVGPTRSRQRYRGVLSGRSRAIWNGRAHIHPDAQRAEVEQEDRNLLLSPEAEVDTKPELEIYADDVKASHGCTVGQLDEDALFYLLSRGVDRDTARSLLIFAFADEVLTDLPTPALRGYVEQQLMEALPDAAGVAGQTGYAA